MAKLMIVFGREEVQKSISYALICETMYGSRWETGKRRRRWVAEFTENERRACAKLKSQAYDWHLRHGVPDEVKMRVETFALWQKLEAFCASL